MHLLFKRTEAGEGGMVVCCNEPMVKLSLFADNQEFCFLITNQNHEDAKKDS